MVLIEAAESLSLAAKHLADTPRPAEWMTVQQAAAYLGFGSVQAFEKVVGREGVPRHYVSGRKPLYNRVELDAWVRGGFSLRSLSWEGPQAHGSRP